MGNIINNLFFVNSSYSKIDANKIQHKSNNLYQINININSYKLFVFNVFLTFELFLIIEKFKKILICNTEK